MTAQRWSDLTPALGDVVRDCRGRPVWCVETAAVVLETDPVWQDLFGYDTLAGQLLLHRPVPGSKSPRSTFRRRPISDADLSLVLRWFNRHGFPDATKVAVADAVELAAQAASFDPLADYLNGLSWDGGRRIDTWLSRYIGASDAPLVRAVGRKWLIAAVARAFKPGCKADHVLVLEGQQGAGKSSALRVLAGDWFADGLRDLSSKDAALGLRGRWIIELAELAAMRRGDIEAVKAFISRDEDRFRPPYGRCEIVQPRRVVFAGTTNRSDWQVDETGGRRFWPVAIGHIDLAGLARDRGALWAEAVAAYRTGEAWWLTADREAEAAEAVAGRSADDPWTADVLVAVQGLDEASTRDVLQRLEVPRERWTKAEAMRIGAILTRGGWRREGKFTGGPSKDMARYVR